MTGLSPSSCGTFRTQFPPTRVRKFAWSRRRRIAGRPHGRNHAVLWKGIYAHGIGAGLANPYRQPRNRVGRNSVRAEIERMDPPSACVSRIMARWRACGQFVHTDPQFPSATPGFVLASTGMNAMRYAGGELLAAAFPDWAAMVPRHRTLPALLSCREVFLKRGTRAD